MSGETSGAAGPLVQIAREGAVATVTLDRPEAFNAFDEALITELWYALRSLTRDETVRAVVLTGAGRAFCAGGNLRAVMAMAPERPGEGFYQVATVFHQCVQEIRTMPKPVIAAINGAAAGGGFSLALACDLRIMADSAFLQQAYTSNGLTMDGGGTFTLPRIVGLARALELCLLDERLSAARSLELGLVTRVVPAAELAATAATVAAELAHKATGAMGRVKQLLNRAFDTALEEQLERERLAITDAANGPEGREGMTAFLARRKPSFG